MYSKRPVSRQDARKGIALLVSAAMSIVVLPMVGLSVDVGVMYVVKTKLSAAADAAAIAGARTLNRGVDFNAQKVNAIATADNYFRANFPNAYLLTTNSSLTTTVVASGLNSRIVTTAATATVPVYFLRFLKDGPPSVTVAAGAVATRRDSNVMMVMDRSKSLDISSSCEPMKVAAAGFVDKFAEQTDFLGLATFGSSAFYLDYPIATNFKTSVPSLPGIIAGLDCEGATNSAQGLWNGYTALASINEPGALNVIVFFTDGNPTAIPGTFAIKGTSPCTDKATKDAVLTMISDSSNNPTNPYGLLNLQNGRVPIPNDNASFSASVLNCAFRANFPTTATQVDSDVASIPAQDYFGDNTTGIYTPFTATMGGSKSTNATSIKNGALNAADAAAKHIRDGDPILKVTPGSNPSAAAAVGKRLAGVVIFAIGLGNSTDPPNADFLMRVANAPGASNYDPNKTKGAYYEVHTADDLDQAFKDVAAEVLRLSK